uniref:Serpentine receptor class gamma n=1 Tax=Acrobeloides nanus TaxID=290746 RepID=A0A914C771_9BILA
MAVNDSLLYIQSLFMSRIPIAGGMSEFYLGNSTLIQVWDNFGYTLNGFMTSFNLLGHTAIAFNRFSSLFLSQRYQWMWSGRRLTSVVILLFVLSLISVCYRIYGPFHYILTVDGVVALYDDPVIRQIYPIERTAIFVSTSILTLVLEASTGIKYRLIWHKLNPYNKVSYNKDMQLFLHSIFIFISHCMMTSYFILYWIAILNGLSGLLHGSQQCVPLIFDFMCLGAPVFLFCVSTVVRKNYLDFYRIRKLNIANKLSPQTVTYLNVT